MNDVRLLKKTLTNIKSVSPTRNTFLKRKPKQQYSLALKTFKRGVLNEIFYSGLCGLICFPISGRPYFIGKGR